MRAFEKYKVYLNRPKRGNIALVMVMMCMVPFVVAGMVGIITSAESLQKRTMTSVEVRYTDYSASELAGYKVISEIDGQDTSLVNEDALESIVEQYLSANGFNSYSVQILNVLESENEMQVKVSTPDNGILRINLTCISLVEVGEEENKTYLIDCSTCEIERITYYE